MTLIEGEGTDKQYYVTDPHGNVVQLTDESGNVIKTYEYDSFGNEVKPEKKDENPFRYCGEYYDKEIEEIYLRARYYQPKVGRFITRDTYTGESDEPLSLHLYTYCGNDGVNAWDPSGHKTKSLNKKIFKTIRKNYRQIKKYYKSLNPTSYNKLYVKWQMSTYFANRVRTGHEWDIKTKKEWKKIWKKKNKYKFIGFRLEALADVGNINYGYVGSCIYNNFILRISGGGYQVISGTSSIKYFNSYLDDPRDGDMILVGAALFNLEHKTIQGAENLANLIRDGRVQLAVKEWIKKKNKGAGAGGGGGGTW